MNEISRRSLSGGGMSFTRTEAPMSDPAGNLVASAVTESLTVARNAERRYDSLNRLCSVVHDDPTAEVGAVLPLLDTAAFDPDSVLPIALVDVDEATENAGQLIDYDFLSDLPGFEPGELKALLLEFTQGAYTGVLFEIRDNDLDGLYTQRIATDGQIRLRLEKTGDDPNGANTVHHLSVYLVFYSANAGLLTEQARIELTQYNYETVTATGAFVGYSFVAQVAPMTYLVDRPDLTYTYDALNRNICSTSTTAHTARTTTVAYDGWREIEMDDDATGYGAGETLRDIIHGNGIDEKVAICDRDTGEYCLLADNTIGNIMAVTSADGSLMEYTKYDQTGRPSLYTPSGQGLAKSTVANPFQLHGRRWDADQNCYYYRNRFYSPDLGRFIHRDPAGMIDGPNMYSAFGENINNSVDPSGLLLFIEGEEITTDSEIYTEFRKGDSRKQELITSMIDSAKSYKYTEVQWGLISRFRVAMYEGMRDLHNWDYTSKYTEGKKFGQFKIAPDANPEFWSVRSPSGSFEGDFHFYAAKGDKSRYDAIVAFMEGPTILDCNTGLQAIILNAAAKAYGKDEFDRQNWYLTLTTMPELPTSAYKYVRKAEPSDELLLGDMVYFEGHKRYFERAPFDYWGGLNTVYMGLNRFKGFGVPEKTSEEIRWALLAEYDRYTEADEPEPVLDDIPECRLSAVPNIGN